MAVRRFLQTALTIELALISLMSGVLLGGGL